MNQKSRAFAVTAALLAASFAAGPSVAQKQGGILKIFMLDSPASMLRNEMMSLLPSSTSLRIARTCVATCP